MLPDKSAENVAPSSAICQADGCRKGNACEHCHFCTAAETRKKLNRRLAMGKPAWETPWDSHGGVPFGNRDGNGKSSMNFPMYFFAFPGYQRVAPLWPLLLRLGLWQSWIVFMVLSVLYICQAVGYLQYPSANSSAGWKHIMMIMFIAFLQSLLPSLLGLLPHS